MELDLELEDDDLIRLTKVTVGNKLNIIVVNGFLSEGDGNSSDWLSLIEHAYPHHTVHHYDWDACNTTSSLINLLASDFSKSLLDIVFDGATLDNSSCLLKSTVEVGLKQWESATRNTEKAGYLLSRHIDRSEGQFILMGHSLGAKVIYHCLESMKMTDKVVSSVLFGGAIEKDVKWQNLLSKHSQMNILNAYSSNDSVLKKLYPFGSKMSNPIGLCPIELSCPDRLINIDMSEVVSGHTKYKTSDVGTFLQHYMSGETSDMPIARGSYLNLLGFS
ncbi:DUF726 domain-containing protein [Vibrio parahaemolyticus]|uniref:DUF726 domain-containing protein n=2 Tax=Vibrio parahaemolyticus TaxID=670 RepID=UPI00084BA784|nr:DUF726 domain-containing protein [Vibrio parahaemolyticus]EID7759953.1 DUF726 domain-containing protein [Vibrio parahaemolyticus]EJG0043545.1 DUF726 domain-containing protein [Vibrio parahaemolyticus]EJO4008813.1 DUF726 domain-containing protein [Vibrio parahaemolyticus]MCZ5877265.1 DUF726 domain-containing protein [Vibrio parahaemolyticus]MCZ6367979.1 DUF726 domain-containing protein [Vibrio parahaemolyticus]